MTGAFDQYNPIVFGYGTSMQPTINRGDILIVKPKFLLSPNEISVGDIIGYRSHDMLIIHRVLETKFLGNETVYYVKGDNNEYTEGPIHFDSILCKVVGIIQLSKYLAKGD